MKTLIFILLLVNIVILVGCETEDWECPVEDRYIIRYDPITYPDGSTATQPIYECP